MGKDETRVEKQPHAEGKRRRVGGKWPKKGQKKRRKISGGFPVFQVAQGNDDRFANEQLYVSAILESTGRCRRPWGSPTALSVSPPASGADAALDSPSNIGAVRRLKLCSKEGMLEERGEGGRTKRVLAPHSRILENKVEVVVMDAVNSAENLTSTGGMIVTVAAVHV